ncbi:MAG: SCP-2 sterol transfer family protein [Alphaproteobacteria bacterium]|nr:SCP-2 sterol transfer family protein [Alphaproteobacteria bacterium]
MTKQEIISKLQDKLKFGVPFQAKVKFDFGDDGIVFIDTMQSPPAFSENDDEADVTLACKVETFEGFLNGTKDPNMAFMMGQLKVRGSMGLAMKMNALLED